MRVSGVRARNQCAIHGAHGTAGDPVWLQASFFHALVGAGLVGTQSETSGQHQRNGLLVDSHVSAGRCAPQDLTRAERAVPAACSTRANAACRRRAETLRSPGRDRRPRCSEPVRKCRKVHGIENPFRRYAALAGHLDSPVSKADFRSGMGIGIDAHHAAEFERPAVPAPIEVEPPRVGIDLDGDAGAWRTRQESSRCLRRSPAAGASWRPVMWPRIVTYGFATARRMRSVCSFLSFLNWPWTLATIKSKRRRTSSG